jgi:ATP-dependent DNA ligase
MREYMPRRRAARHKRVLNFEEGAPGSITFRKDECHVIHLLLRKILLQLQNIHSQVTPMRVSAFIEPCLSSPADRSPSGSDWIHEIKLDGFRMMVRRNPAGVRLLTRNGHDWTGRFPLIARRRECWHARF